ncbi:Predicted arabinose efflux permease, MFS family [Terribacillus halophilus]|uniref:Predicted arabinose efflux permease, MFS family n=1 Tax=Terribacillus halophilus TaxID=361279 RepID=A0A1G6RQM0_9BACI|nr:MFS transporter [Terribacillus halophilus]SDD06942.1 Predicted arabinose efflux permease, MFS family [Terribacillus halophilus]
MPAQKITLTHPLSRLMMSTTMAAMAGQVYSLLLPLLVLEVTSSAIAVTIAIAAERSTMLLQPLIGPLLDRSNWKYVLLLADLTRFLCFLLLSVLAATGQLNLLLICFISICIGFAGQFYQGAQFTAIPYLVSGRQLHYANSLESALYQLTIVIGPSLGGAVLLFLSTYNSLIAVCILSLLAVWLVLLLPYDQHTSSLRAFSISNYIQELKEGFLFIYHQKEIWYTNLISLISNFGVQFLIVLLVIYIDKLTNDPMLIGIVLSSGGIGAMLGTFLGFVADRFSTYRQILFVAKVIGGLSIIFVGLTETIWLAACLNMIGTAAAGAVNPIIKTIRQRYTPRHLLGRVQSTSRFITFTLLPAASIFAGLLSEWIGIGTTILIGGCIASTASVLVWRLPRKL